MQLLSPHNASIFFAAILQLAPRVNLLTASAYLFNAGIKRWHRRSWFMEKTLRRGVFMNCKFVTAEMRYTGNEPSDGEEATDRANCAFPRAF